MKLSALIVLGICIISVASAQQFPPQQFYGYVYVRGDSVTVEAPDGLTVQAVINGEVVATCNTSGGKYGYSPNVLKVQGEEGDVIHFFINGVDTGQTASFESGEFTQLNLTVQDNEPPEIEMVEVEPEEIGVGGTATISVEVKDNLAGVGSVSARIYNESYEETLSLRHSSEIWEVTWTASAEGEYRIDVIAKDRVGNVGEKTEAAKIEVSGLQVSESPTPTPTQTQTPTPTPTPTPTTNLTTPSPTPVTTPTQIPQEKGKIVRIAEIREKPGQYAGKEVVVVGTYLGWHGSEAPPVTRSDWVVRDETGEIYVTGLSPNLDPVKDVGVRILVVGLVELTSDGKPYIRATDVEILPQATPTKTPTQAPTQTPTPEKKFWIPGFDIWIAAVALVIGIAIRRIS